MYHIISIATNIFDVIVTLMFFSSFLNWKTNNKSNHFICGLSMFLITLISNTFIYNNTTTTIISICTLFIISIWFDNKLSRRIFVVIGYMSLVIIADIITTVIIMRFLHSDVNTLLNVAGAERMLAMIFSKLVILCLIKLVSLFKNKDEINLYIKYWAALLTIPIVNIALLIAIINFFDYVEAVNVVTVYVSSICVLYNSILTFYLFDRIIKTVSLKNKYDILENQIVIQSEQVKTNEKENKKFASIRHDLKIHFQTLYNMIINKNYENVEKYLKDTGIVSDEISGKIHTGNIAFDSIINTKLAEADNADINTKIICTIPKDLKMSEIDICVLFGNLLDNAIEACQRAEQTDKFINIYINYKSNRLITCIQNTSDNKVKKVGDNFVSSKSDKENHGIGLYNIKNVVLKYDGVCKMQNEDNKFTVTMTLFNV